MLAVLCSAEETWDIYVSRAQQTITYVSASVDYDLKIRGCAHHGTIDSRAGTVGHCLGGLIWRTSNDLIRLSRLVAACD